MFISRKSDCTTGEASQSTAIALNTILLPASDISLGQANHGASLQNSDTEERIQ